MMLAPKAALAGGLTLAAFGVASLGGCPPSLDDPERFQTSCPPGFSVEATLRQQCGRVGCHLAGDAAAAGLDLASTGVFARLLDRTSATCGEPLVSPLGPDHSLLVEKLEGTTTCGALMPLGGPELPASEIACVRAWILAELAAPPADGGADAGDPGEAGAPDSGDAGADGGN
jgi:hypothetical protein